VGNLFCFYCLAFGEELPNPLLRSPEGRPELGFLVDFLSAKNGCGSEALLESFYSIISMICSLLQAERPGYLLREYSEREARLESLKLAAPLLTDQTAVVDHLPVKRTLMTKFLLVQELCPPEM
jgi:hypothetical protein